MRLSTVFLLVVFLAACGSFVPTVDMMTLPQEQLRAVQQVKIWNSTQLVGQKFDVVTVVEGNSCQNKLTDPPATRAAAIEQLRFHAWEAGASGITALQCGPREGTSMRTNCWELISCTAEAIKMVQ